MRRRRPPRGRQKLAEPLQACSPSSCPRSRAAEKRVTISLRRDPSSPSASSRTSARRTRARPTRRSTSSRTSARASTPGRCECSRRRRTAGSASGSAPSNVGLVTGEERVNERAPVICSTVEMAPHAGELLVLDEVQWADDTERGSAWTRLLLAGEYREILLLGALDALPLVERAFPGARAQGLRAQAPARVRRSADTPFAHDGTVVVAFSRRAVLALAGEVNRSPSGPGRGSLRRDAAVIATRGDRALSLGSSGCLRRDRRARPRSEPARARRSSSRRRRSSTASSVAISCPGSSPRSQDELAASVSSSAVMSGILTGLGWGSPTRSSSSRRSSRTSACRADTSGIAWSTRRGSARSSDLGVEDPVQLDAALVAWHRVALREWARELARGRVAAAASVAAPGGAEAARRAWATAAARGHVEARERSCGRGRPRAARHARRCNRRRPRRAAAAHVPPRHGSAARASLEDAEQAGREASILRWFALQYAGVGGVSIERAAALEEAAAERVVARLRVEVESPTIGRCRSCGRSCAPWFPLCDRCAGSRLARDMNSP